jgi:hypothetical protein
MATKEKQRLQSRELSFRKEFEGSVRVHQREQGAFLGKENSV